MSDVNITFFCLAADQAAANAVAQNNGAGPNNFSVPLSTLPGITDPLQATHFAGSGYMPGAAADAMSKSVAPMIQVRSNDDGTSFDDKLAASNPVLYRIVQGL